ncbi:pyridoxine 5'-phosphate synthase [Cocleimonas flava]|uniref:Pyridoxine 5'-phosphate synthase n=1 Tax=Cocleimonas flava TaxID=634765 RepID=A0A4R1EZU9_9GAMM|nr:MULTISPECIES: pyridoxine 5'-phosphate synthase [Cocleimonas]MEB8433914.1 pyridoxine 5'-phosphate synthase [Cocleimonas sp. KMM 6892]MEC4716725.1 pyridoxine 5'-phosphate synthase [Cocleimonas sp. KMM 6895]MEC4746120.1 pyridoxine 5'-phosphate synthase [Cocleimonas sp. KMM 6896]TCJ84758.1 pyridoxine 5'-phosphate synthase [Cocleimonas flava]
MQDKAIHEELELGVNIDHIATLRQARGTAYPDILEAAFLVEEAGAHAITIHLREDRRHIQDQDVYDIRKQINVRMNLELAATDEMVGIACDVNPEDACIVPEKREELTTEGGLDIIGQFDRIQKCTKTLSEQGIRVSLFIEPDIEQIKRVNDVGAPVIELHTGTYANAQGDAQAREFDRIVEAAEFAHSLGIQVNAGHGLDYSNTTVIAKIPEIRELNIGHSIVSRAVFVGISRATRQMLQIMREARDLG